MGWEANDEDGVEGEGTFGADEKGVDVEVLDGGAVGGREAGEPGEDRGVGVEVCGR